eukprot:scaffold102157_cov108-Cyclotella_meneghiniana.AAC.3
MEVVQPLMDFYMTCGQGQGGGPQTRSPSRIYSSNQCIPGFSKVDDDRYGSIPGSDTKAAGGFSRNTSS